MVAENGSQRSGKGEVLNLTLPKATDVEKEQLPKSAAEARTNVRTRVQNAAGDIVDALIGVAKQGRLAEAKYLFEVAGLYPASEESQDGESDSLAEIVLKSLGLEPDLIKKKPAMVTRDF